MQLPPTAPDTLFEELLQDMPPETIGMAREFKAFVRAKKVKMPEQLLQLVFLYGGLDKSLRESAGNFTLLHERITDQSVAERLRACGPWMQALLRTMLCLSSEVELPPGLRFVVIDASSIQAPGATGTDYRLHISMDLVTLACIEILVTEVHTGETLKHFTLGEGDVAVTDRGYAHAQGMHAAVSRAAQLIVRLNPFSVVLCDAMGEPLDLAAALKHQRTETIRSVAVVIQSACGQYEVQGWVHAYRCHWQIELAIKRWKSVLDMDALRAQEGSPLASVWLHGTLRYALMLERRMRRKLGGRWSRLDGERSGTWWRVWGLISPLLANVMRDDLDAELARRGLRFTRYADDFLIFVRRQRAAERVLRSISRFIEGHVRLRINPSKTKAARLSACTFLGFELRRGTLRWTDAAVTRFKERVREITKRRNGRNMTSRIEALKRYVSGWLNYFGHRRSYAEVVALDQWLRRRIRLCDWKQWKRPRTRRRHLLALGISRDDVTLATRSRKGYWRMAGNSIVQRALTKQWLWDQGVPNMRQQWIGLHYGASAP